MLKMLQIPVLLSLLLTHPAATAESPQVVVSNKPFHSLVAGVMAGQGTPALLITGNQSPHSYALKPRDAQLLQGADLIFWGGESLEPFLDKPLKTLGSRASTLSLSRVAGVTQLPAREWGAWQESHEADEVDEATEHEHEHEGEHPHHGFDPHLWLDPLNAAQMVKAVVATLTEADPASAKHYQQNGEAMQQRLQQLHRDLQQQLAPIRHSPFLVYHDSYQYFERRYQLHALGAVTQQVEHGSSVGAIEQVRAQIAEHQVRCIFKEPQFSSRLVQVAVEGSPARIGVLDPIGANLIPGPELYFQLLRNISRALRSCL